MGSANREERRKVGPADPATRNRLLADALAGTTKPRDTSSTVAGSRDAFNDVGKKAAPPAKPPAGRPGIRGDFDNGVDKVLHPKRNIEKQLEDAGA